MILKTFALFDKKASVYLRPFYAPNSELARRAIYDDVNSEESPISKHPSDYTLYQLGNFDDKTGKINALTPPELICECNELKQPNEKDLSNNLVNLITDLNKRLEQFNGNYQLHEIKENLS